MAVSALSSRMAAQTSGGRKSKRKNPTVFSGTHSTGKSAGWECHQVDRCCNCTRHSTCLILGPSDRGCDCKNAWRQCTDCVCWCQFKNRSAFLLRTPRDGRIGHLSVAEHVPPVNSSHVRALLPAHGTKVGGGRREGGGGGRAQFVDKT